MIYFFDDRTPSRGTRHIWYGRDLLNGTFHRRSYPLHLPLTDQIKEMLHLKKDLLTAKKKYFAYVMTHVEDLPTLK